MGQPAQSALPWVLLGVGIGAGAIAVGYTVHRRRARSTLSTPETSAYADHPYEPANAPGPYGEPEAPDFDAEDAEESEKAQAPVEVPIEEPANNDPGMAITPDGFKARDWNEWMRKATRAIELSLQEGGDVEQIATNAYRRLYPEIVWPPEEGTQLHDDWVKILAIVGRSLDLSWGPGLRVVT